MRRRARRQRMSEWRLKNPVRSISHLAATLPTRWAPNARRLQADWQRCPVALHLFGRKAPRDSYEGRVSTMSLMMLALLTTRHEISGAERIFTAAVTGLVWGAIVWGAFWLVRWVVRTVRTPESQKTTGDASVEISTDEMKKDEMLHSLAAGGAEQKGPPPLPPRPPRGP